ncbi:MAG TPA: phosphoribosylformylglycinamidine cyclo-ligase [Bdellovibrionota bacterium]|nr:phosphoribosylformylglycinamidine cyclo-ligase [Bdellovibrionota bacterium]
MAGKSLTYSKAGVSVSRGDRLVDLIAPLAKRTERAEVMASVGGFAALSRLPRKYRSPVLVTSTDGVGTKVLFAKEMKKFDTVGIDLVAMSVNDILTLGAEPLVFLDYFATGHLNLRMGRDLIAGVAAGCRQAGCALVGGETAEMPKVYRSGDFDLAGFCVGVVESNGIIDGQKVRPGDAIVGWPSSGVHSNGYSLVRAVLKRNGLSLRSRPAVLNGKTLGEELLRPTRIYVREILSLMKKVRIKAMAHITGGGIEGNLPRVFPRGTSAEIDRSAWKVPPIFRYLQERGRITDREMYRTFNMGVGFIFVVGRSDLSRALRLSAGAREIGRVIPAPGEARVSWR